MLINLRNKLKNQKGFSLIELMVVISIIGVLAAIAIPKFSNATETAKIAKVQADLQILGNAIATYESENSTALTADNVVNALTPKYVTAIPNPPKALGTSTPTSYTFSTSPASYSIAIAGCADGRNGTYKSDGTLK